MIRIVRNATVKSAQVKALASRQAAPSAEVESVVRGILARVRAEGMPAVLDYARKFDGLKGSLRATPAELERAAAKCPDEVRKAIRQAIKNVRAFHKRQLEKGWEFAGAMGEKLGVRVAPLRRVGLYVPGGAAVYPSTVIMDAVPAQVAGVSEIAVVTPARNGLNPAVACALRELGIDEVYKLGGAQAVAMLAYGAGPVARVDKIVGPGNVYAALAKKEVFGVVDIDMIAGPSELMVLADETSDPDWVAADLLSQAEHGSGFEAVVCVTDSERHAKWIAQCVEEQVLASPKRELLEKVLANYGCILVVKDWDAGAAIADAVAPEHLELAVANPRALMAKIRNAGAIFLGSWSTEPIGDYIAGPNHTLPTNGTARFSSPLGVYDFLKRTSVIEYNAKAMRRYGPEAAALADAEGFVQHAAAIRKRL